MMFAVAILDLLTILVGWTLAAVLLSPIIGRSIRQADEKEGTVGDQ